jgi:hypothetical protein
MERVLVLSWLGEQALAVFQARALFCARVEVVSESEGRGRGLRGGGPATCGRASAYMLG